MITLLLIIISILWFAGTMAQFGSFKYYKSTYDSLVNGTAILDYKYGGLYYFCDPNEKGQYSSEIVIFTHNDGTLKDVKVGPWDYIHGGLLAYMSPYSYHWLVKYRDWFEKNKNTLDSSK